MARVPGSLRGSAVRASAGALAAGLVLLLLLPVGQAQTDRLDRPAYHPGDRWEYRVEGRLAEVPGLGEGLENLTAEGVAVLTPTAATPAATTLRWRTELTVEGNLSLATDGAPLRASFTGRLTSQRDEVYEGDRALPTTARSATEVELAVEAGGLAGTLEGRVESTVNRTAPEGLPAYPLEAGTREVMLATRTEVDAHFAFLLGEFENRSVEDTVAVLRLRVEPGGTLETPWGSLATVEVTAEALQGPGTGPFSELVPGAAQVARIAPEVGAPVVLEATAEDVPLVTATLTSFVRGGAPPFWQQPAFVLALLAAPAALLVYLGLRERRRGL